MLPSALTCHPDQQEGVNVGAAGPAPFPDRSSKLQVALGSPAHRPSFCAVEVPVVCRFHMSLQVQSRDTYCMVGIVLGALETYEIK